MARWIRLGNSLLGGKKPEEPKRLSPIDESWDTFYGKCDTKIKDILTDKVSDFLKRYTEYVTPEALFEASNILYNQERARPNAKTKTRKQGTRRHRATKETKFRI